MPTEDSGSASDDSEAGAGSKYNKYRSLFENKSSSNSPNPQRKWEAPKKKLGAPPPLEYNYSGPSKHQQPEPPKPEPPSPSKKKVVLPKSNVFSKDDMAAISSMLVSSDDEVELYESSTGSGSTDKERVATSTQPKDQQVLEGKKSAGDNDDHSSDGKSTDDDDDLIVKMVTEDDVIGEVINDDDDVVEEVVGDGDDNVIEEVVEEVVVDGCEAAGEVVDGGDDDVIEEVIVDDSEAVEEAAGGDDDVIEEVIVDDSEVVEEEIVFGDNDDDAAGDEETTGEDQGTVTTEPPAPDPGEEEPNAEQKEEITQDMEKKEPTRDVKSRNSFMTDSSDDGDFADVWEEAVMDEAEGEDRASMYFATAAPAISRSPSPESMSGLGGVDPNDNTAASSALASAPNENDEVGNTPMVAMMATSKKGESDEGEGSIDVFDLNASDGSNEKSADEFSLRASQDLFTGNDDVVNNPEYEPRKNDEARTEDSSSLLDFNQSVENMEAGKVEPPQPKRKKTKRRSNATPLPYERPSPWGGAGRGFVRGVCFLLFAGAIGAPIYFFLFHEFDTNEETPDVNNLFPIITNRPTSRPIGPLVPPPDPPVGPPPTERPTWSPTISPTTGQPSSSPTLSTITKLRIFIQSVWPRVVDDFFGFTTAQWKALDWLANNENLDSYPDRKRLQRFALATLFFSTVGEEWRNNDLWLSDEDECLWFTSSTTRPPCNEDGVYVNLELDLNGLAGSIPPELALLSDGLARIDFSRSGSEAFLNGPIPSELGLLTKLTFIDLRGNSLSGAIPEEIGGWVETEFLDLSGNVLVGLLPTTLGAMTSIETLHLQGNQITGTLATELGQLTRLRYMNLAGNSVGGSLPSDLGILELLEDINFDLNRFTSLPTELGRLSRVRSLSIFNNNLGGTIPSEMGNMVDLLSLDLGENELRGTIPTQLGNLIQIRDSLSLAGNRLTGSIPTEFGALSFLRNLLLNDNRLTGGVPRSFASLRRLNSLRLETNRLNETVPSAVCDVFDDTVPVFSADCTSEFSCSCCMFCCLDGGACQCQFENTDLDFLCVEFTTSSGLEERLADFFVNS